MRYELYALIAAFSFGLNAVMIKRGMKESTPVTATLVIAFVQVAILSVLAFLYRPEFNWTAVLYFIVAGVGTAIFGRTLNYISIDKIGVPITSSLTGTNPLFTIIIANIFLGEHVSITTIISSLLVASGIVLMSGWGAKVKIDPRNLLLPLGSAFFYAVSGIVRKAGLNILPEPFLGAVVGAATSLVAYPLILKLMGRSGELKFTKSSLRWFIGGGVATTLAWVGMFTATQLGSISVVSAIIGANPLFGLILSLLMLRDVEKITMQVAAGSLLIVIAMIVITLF